MNRGILDPTYPQHPTSLPEQIRKARMDAWLQIKELAWLAQIHEMTIVNWEQGHTQPEQRKLARVEEVLRGKGVTLLTD